MQNQYQLYGYWRSSATWRVRIAFHLKKIPFEYIPVHLVKSGGEQNSVAYQAINPMAQVPTLIIKSTGGVINESRNSDELEQSLTQSMAIISYLDQRYPDCPLFPTDPFLKAKVIAFAEIINSGIQPLQNLNILAKIEQLGGDRNLWAKDVIHKGLVALEALAKSLNAQDTLVGQISIAEIFLIPQLYNGRRFQVDLSAFPHLLSIENHVKSMDAFIKALPENQIDAQI